ncbi:MAG: Rieske (2Fe-2S) protein [Pseudomonadales bacterium]|nr:Rieske (2Fe-2S) protein [Pseudomonadales bacterium]
MKFYPLEKLHCLQHGYRKTFSVAGRNLLLLQDEDQTYLIENRCPHQGAPLEKGLVKNGTIVCPYHRLAFSLYDGKHINNSSYSCQKSLSCYKPRYQDNLIGVLLDESP